MAEKSIEELIVPGNIWNPFPKVRYTERPDVAAVHLLEGHVVVIVILPPVLIIAPLPIFIMSNMLRNTVKVLPLVYI